MCVCAYIHNISIYIHIPSLYSYIYKILWGRTRPREKERDEKSYFALFRRELMKTNECMKALSARTDLVRGGGGRGGVLSSQLSRMLNSMFMRKMCPNVALLRRRCNHSNMSQQSNEQRDLARTTPLLPCYKKKPRVTGYRLQLSEKPFRKRERRA